MLSFWKLLKKNTKKNAFQLKVTSNKLKIMFANLNDFTEFKTIYQKENIEYYTYTVHTLWKLYHRSPKRFH